MFKENEIIYSDARGPYWHTDTEIAVPKWYWTSFMSRCEKEKVDPNDVLQILMRLYLDGKIIKIEDCDMKKLKINIFDKWQSFKSAEKTGNSADCNYGWHKDTLLIPNVLAAEFQVSAYKEGFYPDLLLTILLKSYAEMEIDQVPQSLIDEYWRLNQGGARDGKEWWYYLDDAARSLGVDYEFGSSPKKTVSCPGLISPRP